MADRGHNGHAWRQVRRHILHAPEFLACWLCHQPIDRRLRYPDPKSASVDLVVPYARGGDPLDPHNLRPAHLDCNVRRGAGEPTRRHWLSADSP